MLERASLCLESGGRHLLRGSKSKAHIRSRRMLHSSFWHHGAGDLNLPPSWPSVLLPFPTPDLHEPSRQNATTPDGLFLDFLYPDKTLTLMRRLSSSGWESWHASRVRVPTSGAVRHFSSKSPGPGDEPEASTPLPDEDLWDRSESFGSTGPHLYDDTSPMGLGETSDFDFQRPPEDLENPENWENARDWEDPEDLETDETWVNEVENPAETLQSLLEAGERDSKVIWSLWRRTDTASRTPELSAAILDYFCSVRPFPVTLAEEVVVIFDSLDMEDRRASSYRGAIKSYLAMGRLGKAGLVHEQGILSGHAHHTNIGSSELLAHAIKKERWQLAVEVYSEITSLVGQHKEFWSVALKNLRLYSYVESMLRYFRRIRLLTGKHPEELDQIRTFAAGLGGQAITQYAKTSQSSTEGGQLYCLILRLQQSRFLEPHHLEKAVNGLLSTSKAKVQAIVIPRVVRKLFFMYISTAKADPSFKPSEEVLYTLLFGITRNMNVSHGSHIRGPRLEVGHIVAAAYRFHGRPNINMLELLMSAYAHVGNVEKVSKALGMVGRTMHKPYHYEFVLEAYARRGDTAGATQVFEQLIKMSGGTPHIKAWNKLLHAYARAEDLVGASRVFDDLMESSHRPDAHSFAAILDILSQKGDVDGVKDMFALAADIDPNMIQSTEVAGYLVTALINNDDMETAELVAEQLRSRRESGRMGGSFMPIWNNLATAYALRRDVASTRRIYEEMQSNGAQPDGMTYAALLQALCLTRNTDAAFKVLRVVMPQKLGTTMAFHYAIVMAGYINEGSYEKVPYVDNLRKHRGVRASMSTRMTVTKAVALSEHAGRYKKGPNQVFQRTSKVLSAMLEREDPWDWSAEPQTGLGYRSLGQASGAYLDIVMLIQGDRHALETVEQLAQLYAKRHQDRTVEGATPPLRMLYALMNAQWKAGLYEEVERLWNLAVETATNMTQLVIPKAAVNPENDHPPSSLLAPTLRHVLSRPLVIYLRTLHIQGRYADAQSTVSSLLAQGFTLDNLAWNLYVQLLARTGRIVLAFGLCEKYLMPQWVGWRSSMEKLRRRYRYTRGWDYMNVNPNLAKRNTILPQYRTMVILAAALKYVRRQQAIGGVSSMSSSIGDAPASEALLRARSPRTIAALQAMPHIDDDLQARFLGND